ncbi:formylglycine-generating enzyme required for sulfatase activity [Yoonia maricola]|uniref:Formylglycine-generating enzyme required for sulfatase activity n=1 Tax=Yoonia maricola TaxID=420999 RepID=A0A2M8W139_9RHOB|nr:SUMF1/EgtB/PvdO family nonheme iron enzyme [Yoonia maricola]PJI84637.1 formylglycine-generating enzyme required for sulfatase activity [Yoonia maricola]
MTSAALVDIPAGRFVMGSDQHYPEEAPERHVDVPAFQMDASAISNAAFAAFIADTGYVTSCERPYDAGDQSALPDVACIPGSLVFQMTRQPVRLTDPRQWWTFVPGAYWRCPEGPGSSIEAREDHPVVHVSCDDALAYATWAGKALPTEAQWEYAAAQSSPCDPKLNIWRDAFPYRHHRVNGHPFTVPAGAGQPSGRGLSNMLGNVWEWTATPYQASHAKGGCCATPETDAPSAQTVMTLKGGSYLCADNYCRRYRPSARIGLAQNETAGHIGFRCVTRAA